MFQAVSRPSGAFQAACHAPCSSVVILTAAFSVLLSRFITFRCEPSLHSIQPVSSPPAAHNFARLRVAAGCGLSCFLCSGRMDRFSKVALKRNKKHASPCVSPSSSLGSFRSPLKLRPPIASVFVSPHMSPSRLRSSGFLCSPPLLHSQVGSLKLVWRSAIRSFLTHCSRQPAVWPQALFPAFPHRTTPIADNTLISTAISVGKELHFHLRLILPILQRLQSLQTLHL